MNIHQPQCVKITAIQSRCGHDITENQTNTVQQIRVAAQQGADIVCLQELFATQYFCQTENHQNFQLAEPIPGPSTDIFADLAAELKIVIVASVFEKRAAGIYHNSAVILDTDGTLAGVYRKMHIPDDPGYYEKFYFTPGDLGFQAFQTSKAKIGVCICWDQWFPEAARLTALAGAEVLIYPTAIGWLVEEKESFGDSQLNSWQTMMRSHAIANGLFVIAPNRFGLEGNIQFWGNSFISDPYGNVLASANDNDEALVTAECDLRLIETARTHWPFLRDRRIDMYSDLNKRYLDVN